MAKKKTTFNDEFNTYTAGRKAHVIKEQIDNGNTTEKGLLEWLSQKEVEYVDPELTVYGKTLNFEYTMLTDMKEADSLMFERALFCVQNGLDPTKMYEEDLIALEETFAEYVEQLKKDEKKNFSMVREDVKEHYNEVLLDREKLSEYRNEVFIDPHKNEYLIKDDKAELEETKNEEDISDGFGYN